MGGGFLTVALSRPLAPVERNVIVPRYYDAVGTFSTVKWVLFQLSRFRLNGLSGSFFDCQMGTFSLDKNRKFINPTLNGRHATRRALRPPKCFWVSFCYDFPRGLGKTTSVGPP